MLTATIHTTTKQPTVIAIGTVLKFTTLQKLNKMIRKLTKIYQNGLVPLQVVEVILAHLKLVQAPNLLRNDVIHLG